MLTGKGAVEKVRSLTRDLYPVLRDWPQGEKRAAVGELFNQLQIARNDLERGSVVSARRDDIERLLEKAQRLVDAFKNTKESES